MNDTENHLRTAAIITHCKYLEDRRVPDIVLGVVRNLYWGGLTIFCALMISNAIR